MRGIHTSFALHVDATEHVGTVFAVRHTNTAHACMQTWRVPAGVPLPFCALQETDRCVLVTGIVMARIEVKYQHKYDQDCRNIKCESVSRQVSQKSQKNEPQEDEMGPERIGRDQKRPDRTGRGWTGSDGVGRGRTGTDGVGRGWTGTDGVGRGVTKA